MKRRTALGLFSALTSGFIACAKWHSVQREIPKGESDLYKLDNLSKTSTDLKKITVQVAETDTRLCKEQRPQLDQLLSEVRDFYKHYNILLDFRYVPEIDEDKLQLSRNIGLEILTQEDYLLRQFPTEFDDSQLQEEKRESLEVLKIIRAKAGEMYEQGNASYRMEALRTDEDLENEALFVAKRSIIVRNCYLQKKEEIKREILTHPNLRYALERTGRSIEEYIWQGVDIWQGVEKEVIDISTQKGTTEDLRRIFLNQDGHYYEPILNECLGDFDDLNIPHTFEDPRYYMSFRKTVAHEIGHAMGLFYHAEEVPWYGYIPSSDNKQVLNVMGTESLTCPTKQHPYGFGINDFQIYWMHSFTGRGQVYDMWIDTKKHPKVLMENLLKAETVRFPKT